VLDLIEWLEGHLVAAMEEGGNTIAGTYVKEIDTISDNDVMVYLEDGRVVHFNLNVGA
jgi:hypothetical protein